MLLAFVDDIVIVVPEGLHHYALSLIPVLRGRFAAKGVRLNEKKFYDQPATHGVEFLGSHIKPNRVCLNSGTIETALMRVDEMNGWEDKEARIESFIASVNSYTGLTKNRTNHKATIAIKERTSPEWWQYVEWNDARKCVNARPGYKHNEMLDKKYHLKLKYHDKRRNKGKAQ